MNEQHFYSKLTQFLRLLQTENKVLKANQADKLPAIVAQKETFVTVLNDYLGEVTPRIKAVVAQIKLLQEQNLLLTQLEMDYQKMLMDAVRESVKETRNPYGKAQPAQAPAATLVVNTDM